MLLLILLYTLLLLYILKYELMYKLVKIKNSLKINFKKLYIILL